MRICVVPTILNTYAHKMWCANKKKDYAYRTYKYNNFLSGNPLTHGGVQRFAYLNEQYK